MIRCFVAVFPVFVGPGLGLARRPAMAKDDSGFFSVGRGNDRVHGSNRD